MLRECKPRQIIRSSLPGMNGGFGTHQPQSVSGRTSSPVLHGCWARIVGGCLTSLTESEMSEPKQKGTVCPCLSPHKQGAAAQIVNQAPCSRVTSEHRPVTGKHGKNFVLVAKGGPTWPCAGTAEDSLRRVHAGSGCEGVRSARLKPCVAGLAGKARCMRHWCAQTPSKLESLVGTPSRLRAGANS